MTDEVWKPIDGYEGIYEISNKGRVRSLTRKVYNYTKPGRILKPHDNGHSYLSVGLSKNGVKLKHAYIHILVARAFIPNPDNFPQVNHKDFNKQNNCVENLEWVTDRQNKLHYLRSKRAKNIEKKRVNYIHSKVFKKIRDHKKTIISMFETGYSIMEIAKEIDCDKEFVTNVLMIFDYI